MKSASYFLVFLIIIFFLSVPALAVSFSDGFEDDTFNAWDFVGVNFAITTPSWDASKYAYSTGVAQLLRKNINSTQLTYWSYRFSTGGGQNAVFRFRSDNDGVGNDCYVSMVAGRVHSSGNGACAAILDVNLGTYEDTALNVWYKVTIEDLGTTLRFSLYNSTSGNVSLITSSTIADVTTFISNRIILFSPNPVAPNFKWDDIEVSSVAPSASNSITWDSDSHFTGDIGYYDYVVKDAEWSCAACVLYQIRANVYKGTIEMDSVALSAQTGRLYYQFGSLGTDLGGYTVKLISYLDGYYNLGFSGTELASDDTSLRSIGDSRIFVNSSVSSGIPQNITFMYGYNNPGSAANGIAVFWYDGNTWIEEGHNYISSVCGSSCVAGTLYTIPIIFTHDGLFRLDLRGHGHGVVASAETTATFIGNVITTHLQTSYVETDSDIYFPAEDADVSYGVDDTNYTNYKIYLELYNYSKNTTLDSVFITKQQSRDTYYFKLERDFSKDFLVMPGLNRWSLVAYYPNLTKYSELAYKNITISKVNGAGYGLIPNKNEACKSDKIVFDLISPSYFTLNFLEPSGNYVILNFSNSSKYSWSTTRTAGNYFITINDPSTNIQASTTITIKDCIVGVTPPPTGGAFAASEWLGTSSWLAIIMLVMFVGTGAASAGAAGMIGGAMIAIPILYLAPGDYSGHMIPVWIVFLEAGIIFIIVAVLVGTAITKTR